MTKTYLNLAMYDLPLSNTFKTLQLQLQFTVDLPDNWNTDTAQSGRYPINTDIKCLLFDPVTRKFTDSVVSCFYGTQCYFHVFENNSDINTNASFCFEGRIQLKTDLYTFTNFLYMNGKIYDNDYISFTQEGVLSTGDNHSITFYANDSTDPNKEAPTYYMRLTNSNPQSAAPKPKPTPVAAPRMSMKSLFSNNAQVFYKPHSLSTGSGGVTNYRAKQRKT
jgi:hypothetical protein